MCGIGGWIGVVPDAQMYAKLMLSTLHHRGPDANGIQSWPEATLVHTRLSIIDLSRAAADSIGLLSRGVGQVQVSVSEEALELRDAHDAVMYEVQVGAFLEIEQAQEMVEELQRTYAAAYIATRDGPFGSYHRVRIGPFEARREAYEVAQGLVQEGYYVFLDEVAASSLLHQRLRLAGEKGSREFEPVAPAGDDAGGVDVRQGIAYYMHSFD